MQEGAGNRALHRIPLVTAHRVTVTSPAFSPGAGLIDVMIGSEVESDQFFFKKLCDQVPDLSLEELDIRVICPFYSNELYVRPFSSRASYMASLWEKGTVRSQIP